MKFAKRLTGWFFRSRRTRDLDASISEALAEGEKTRESAMELAATSHLEWADATHLSGTVQERLAKIEKRKERRKTDPRLSVVAETIRILEGR
jgi:hypothetical protein